MHKKTENRYVLCEDPINSSLLWRKKLGPFTCSYLLCCFIYWHRNALFVPVGEIVIESDIKPNFRN